VQVQLDRQGWSTGERPIHHALDGQISLARVRYALRELKAEHRARRARRLAAVRVTTRVLLRDAVWSMDATHLGRDPTGAEVQAEVVREVASTRTIGLSVGPPATDDEVVELLEHTVRVRGTAPLALITDHGGSYRSRAVAAWCRRYGVLHLFTVPHTPQHNAGSERGMRDLKEETLLGKGVLVLDTGEACAALVDAVRRIDGHRLRASRGWRTAVEDDLQRPSWQAHVDRDALYQAVACAILPAVLNSANGRARRRAIRAAILDTLEAFAVITRTRGGRT
jgi:transposase InsO family protein